MNTVSRRRFLSWASGSSAASIAALQPDFFPRLSAQEAKLDSAMVRFRPEIEPLVRLLESTPRSKIVDTVCQKIRTGTSYREWLAALFLAGIRNVQPRPAVGFKFHTVLVVHSAHQASVAAADDQRWLPLIWAIDYFKSAQASDVQEGDWTMSSVDENRLPAASQALREFDEAMEKWDEARADVAAAAAARTATQSQLLDRMARHAARDFRSIGHKAIYVAGAFRTLEVIGWEHAEPVMRSLAYAILNHTGDPNPSTSDVEADRAGRRNWEKVAEIPPDWIAGRIDPLASRRVLEGLRQTSPDESSAMVVAMLREGIHPRSIYDGIFLAAAELVARQPAIVPLHAVTTTNALHHLFNRVTDDASRRWLLLQNASFIAHFREAAKSRDDLPEWKIDELAPAEGDAVSVDEIFRHVHRERDVAAGKTLRYLTEEGDAESLVRQARTLVFLKGSDSHDYKFSSAAIEDFYWIHPQWRHRYLAGCTYLLHGEAEKTTALAEKVLANT